MAEQKAQILGSYPFLRALCQDLGSAGEICCLIGMANQLQHILGQCCLRP
jgi:hypothetical protein